MKIQREKINKKRITVIIAALVIITASIGGFFAYPQSDEVQKTATETPAPNVERQINKKSDEVADRDGASPEQADETPVESTSSPAREIVQDGDVIRRNTQTSDASLSISRLEPSASTVTAVVLTHGITTGDCSFILTKQDLKVSHSSTIQQGPTYFACQASIPRSQLEPGVWQVEVSAIDNSGLMATTRGEVSL